MRALRVMFVANDGLSAGHVARMVAIARGLERRLRSPLARVFATTSDAHRLLAAEPLAVINLPNPSRARAAGLEDGERRHLVRAVLEGAARSFAPDLLVVDTFPEGPHRDLADLGELRAKRVLVRRSVPADRAGESLLTAGLGRYDLAIAAADPLPIAPKLPIRTVSVPPIVIGGARLGRAEARAELGLPAGGRLVLVTTGGGGDPRAAEQGRSIAAAVDRLGGVAVLACGPLDPAPSGVARTIRVAPLAPYLAAFDGAFSAAGYNTTHELASAGIPAALFARPRPYDDQAARAERFAAEGHATVLTAFDDEAIAAALDWIAQAMPPGLSCDGAERAADAMLALVGAGAATGGGE